DAGGALSEPPHSYVGVQPLSGAEMRRAIETADDNALTFVQGGLEMFLKLFPALVPVLLPANSPLQEFMQEALELFRHIPAPVVALFAAALITNVQRRRTVEELTPEMIQLLRPEAALPALFRELDDKQKETFLSSLKSANQ